MLNIQVLGKGMIPRGYGLAPRKEFFKADLTTIQSILITPNLKVNMRNPEDGKIIPVTNSNLRKLWDKYRSDRVVNMDECTNNNEVKVDPKPVDTVKPEPLKPVDAPTKEPEVKVETKIEEKDNNKPVEKKPDTLTVDAKKPEVVKNEVKEEKDTKPEVSTIKPIIPENKNNNGNKKY